MAAKKFNFSAIKKRRNRIAAFLLERYVNTQLTGDTIYQLANNLLDFLPSTVSVPAVFESVRILAGITLDRKRITEFAWQIAGNVDKLNDGEFVMPWTRQIEDEIVPVRVELVTPTRRKNDFGFVFLCRALAGSPCTLAFPQFFTARSCNAISRVVGFSTTPWGLHPYAGVAAHFTNLMFFAHIEAERSRERPVFHSVSISSGMLRANKELLEVRCRTKPCPRGFPTACSECPIGYGECSYAVHQKTYVEQHCRTCDKLAFFDPAEPGIMCISCQQRNNCTV